MSYTPTPLHPYTNTHTNERTGRPSKRYGESKPAELARLEQRLIDYQKTLHKLGLRDYQVGRHIH